MKINQLIFLGLGLLIVSSQGWSQETEAHPFLNDKFYIEAGVYIPSKNIKVGADGSSPNDEIDFDESFGLNDNESTLFLHFEWRWNKKWKLSGETFGVNYGNTWILPNDIKWEDVIIKEGSNVSAGVEFDLYRVFVGRVISSGQKHSLGAGLGIHGLNLSVFIEGDLYTSIEDLDPEFGTRKVSAFIPLPNIGAWYYWAPTKKWAISTRVDWFGITIDKYSGGLWNIAPGIKYQIIDNFGLGIDYRLFFLNAKIDDSNWKGGFDLDFSGPLITLHGNF